MSRNFDTIAALPRHERNLMRPYFAAHGGDGIAEGQDYFWIPGQIESAVSSRLPDPLAIGHTETSMTKPDPTLAQIAAEFTQYAVERSGGGYMILDRPTSNPIARLRPIPNTDRFELFYWSNVKDRWTTFGNMGRMKLMLESAHEIVEKSDVPYSARPMNRSKLAKVKLRAPLDIF